MNQAIIGFHLDEHGDYVANLKCGHTQHVRHNPPWENRAWVMTEETRLARIGAELFCKECSEVWNKIG